MPLRLSRFFPATQRPRIFGCALLILTVLAINSFHFTLSSNGSLRNSVQKRSSQDLELLNNLRPLRRTKRRWVITTMKLEEEDKGPFPKLVGELFNNMAQNLSLKYLISGPGVDEYPEAGLFSIKDDAEGHVYVHRTIDREKYPSFLICFDVADRMTGEIVDRSLYFNIRIGDINDNAPEFPKKEFNITMKENHNRGEPVFNATAFDKDEEGTANSRITYSLVSQTPRPNEPVFTVDSSSGTIRITGCSDYEAARSFRLLIKATDHGRPRLSSTATINIALEDSNNNPPKFTQDNYRLDISEGKSAHDVLRLQVEDKDSPNTAAWKAKYKIMEGSEKENFAIETDPLTNEGFLSVIKPLAYNAMEWKLVISVENEEPLFSCDRGKMQSSLAKAKAYVNVNVTEKNDAPQFIPPVLVLRQEEGATPGTRIGVFTAKDAHTEPHSIRYKLALDPAKWVMIDESSGIVTALKTLDRESAHVNNNIYTIVIHAIDDGVPPLTGTGTIQLYLSDINDNAPLLVTPLLKVCNGKEREPFLIRAEDKDSDPYAGPFTFQLMGNAADSWKLGENFGDSVQLFMQRSLPVGNYSIPLRILDKQGFFKEQILHVRVCLCQDGNTCEEKVNLALESVSLGGGAIAVILSGFFLLLLGLGLLLWCSSKQEIKKGLPFIPYEDGNQTLIHYNGESQHVLSQDTPDVGDHTTPFPVYGQIWKEKPHTVKGSTGLVTSHSQTSSQGLNDQNAFDIVGTIPKKGTEESGHTDGRIVSYLAIPENSHVVPDWYQQMTLPVQNKKIYQKNPRDRILETVEEILNQKRDHITNIEDRMVSDYPRVYAEEGHLEKSESFWSLPMAEDANNSLSSDFLDSLGPRFITLGRICGK
uniref:Cadherin-like protein 26 n=1 Tax=Salvator merianae TaxID=96440 RepID=A0A8D0C1L3_SALMN